MKIRFFASAVVLPLVVACGGSDDSGLSGSGGAAGSAGAGTGGGSAGSAGSGATAGNAGSGGGAGTGGGAGAGGSAGSAGAGGSAGSAGAGGSAGSAGAGGSAGSGGATGGTGGTGGATGGTGGATGGTGGSTGGTGGATGGTGGGTGGGCAVMKTYCRDTDGDGYGDPSTEKKACESPGPGWVNKSSKARACEDCADDVKSAFPNSNHCDGSGYPVGGGVSFDFNCDTKETECGAPSIKAKGDKCVPSTTGPVGCTGAGYLPTKRTGTNQNEYCGSDQFRICVMNSPGNCATSIQKYNPIVCK